MNTPGPTLPAHGTLLELDGIGVYLIGHSGVGKSEIALQLIDQGACLICDDAPNFKTDLHHEKLSGSCPKSFYGLMHIHDLGIINISELISPASFKDNHSIDFIIELVATDTMLAVTTQQTPQQLLSPNYQNWQYQHWTISGIRLHLYPNRNIPLLIKTAVKQFTIYNKMKQQ